MTEFTDIVRCIVRETRNLERGKLRQRSFNKSRLGNEISKNLPEMLTEIDIKRFIIELRKSTSDKEAILTNLKNAFIKDRQNIISFMKVEGSLHTLVGSLSNHNPFLQMLAAECCCNISLGDQKSCFQLAKSAGPYMILILQGMNYNLMNYCLMTLGNVCAGSRRSVILLKSQGILKIFEKSILIPEVRESAAYALVLYTKSNQVEGDDELADIAKTIIPFAAESVNIQWLIFHLSSIESIRTFLMEKGIVGIFLLKLNSLTTINQTNIQSVTCILRALANLVSEPSGEVALDIFKIWDIAFAMAKRIIDSGYPHLKTELAWLFGNIVNHPEPEVQVLVQQKYSDLAWIGRESALV